MEVWKNSSILITGAAGFIASCLAAKLNEEGFENLILVDDFSSKDKSSNHKGKFCKTRIHRDHVFEFLNDEKNRPDFIFHLGARTDTAEFRKEVFDELNLNYSKKIWSYCVEKSVPLVYASSAATYGDGSLGFSDDHEIIPKLKPLNPYGESKQAFDLWVLEQGEVPPFWAGVKFFNVYGPNEYHKGRMASVIYHSFFQARDNNIIRLFKSYKPGYPDGAQVRDFIYVKDAVDALSFLMESRPIGGIFNLGTGKAQSWNDLANAVFKSLGKPPKIEYIDIPEDIRERYQYFTEANMQKLIGSGYSNPFLTLKNGVDDYISHYLSKDKYW